MAEGVISRAAVKRVISGVGVDAAAAAKGDSQASLSLNQFIAIVDGLQGIIEGRDTTSGAGRASEQEQELQVFMDDHAAMQAEDRQSAASPATVTATATTSAAAAADMDHELREVAREAFNDLASGAAFLSPSAFLEWDDVAAMVEEGIVDRTSLVQLAGAAPIDFDAFYGIVTALDSLVEASLVGDGVMGGVLGGQVSDHDDDDDNNNIINDDDDDNDEEMSLEVNDEFLQAVEEVFDELRGKDAKVRKRDKETHSLQEPVQGARYRPFPHSVTPPKSP